MTERASTQRMEHRSTLTDRWEACTALTPDTCRYEQRRVAVPKEATGFSGVAVTSCEKLSVRGVLAVLQHDCQQARNLAEQVVALPTKNKFNAFKECSAQDVLDVYNELARMIRFVSNPDAKFMVDNSNQRGSDIEDLIGGIGFELKWGAATSGNLGFSDLVLDLFDEEIRALFPTDGDRTYMRKLFKWGRIARLQEFHRARLRKVKRAMARRVGKRFTSPAQLRLNAIALGVNHNDEILAYQASGGKIVKQIVGLQVGQTRICNFRQQVTIAEEGTWYLRKVEYTRSGSGRLSFWVEDECGNQIKFTYNYKKSYDPKGYKDKNGNQLSAPAKYGLGGASWNCWVMPAGSGGNRTHRAI